MRLFKKMATTLWITPSRNELERSMVWEKLAYANSSGLQKVSDSETAAERVHMSPASDLTVYAIFVCSDLAPSSLDRCAADDQH